MGAYNDIVKLAVDSYHGNVEKYSVDRSQEVLRQALVETNGGETALNYRNIRDGKCNGVFSIVEEILDATAWEGLTSSDYFMNLVEYRNVAMGDANSFLVEDTSLYAVATAADGTQGIRRQRIAGVSEVTVPTYFKVVRIYEELNRILSGRVDFNKLIDKVAKSYEQQLLNDIYSLWSTATATQLGGETYFPTAGAYDEDTLLDVIAHVEAASGGKTATIIGTKKALRHLYESIDSYQARDELHTMGYVGTFYGSPVVAIPQRHKIGTTEFILDDYMLTIVAGDDKPVKVVNEGESIVIPGDPLNNADLTQEYFFGQKVGMGLVLAGSNSGIGRYEFTE